MTGGTVESCMVAEIVENWPCDATNSLRRWGVPWDVEGWDTFTVFFTMFHVCFWFWVKGFSGSWFFFVSRAVCRYCDYQFGGVSKKGERGSFENGEKA